MPEEIIICPLCGKEKNRLFDQRQDGDHTVVNRLCVTCGLVFESPRMTAAEADVYYQAEYRKSVQGHAEPIKKDIDVQIRRSLLLLGFLKKQVDHLESHLDIGCSTGSLLRGTREAYGAAPTGVEPGEAYRGYARQNDIPVFDTLEAVEAGNKRFDLISLVHVLEHLHDPIAYLIRLREKLMDTEGWLLVEVPNVYSHTSFEFSHLYSFSRRTLIEVLRKAGYETRAIQIQGMPVSKMFPYYLTVLARPARKAESTFRVHRERWVGLKRWLGLTIQRIIARLLPKHWWWVVPVADHENAKHPINEDSGKSS